MAHTLVDKIWAAHRVGERSDGAELIYIDRVFLHERTGSIALKSLQADGRSVRNPDQVFCTMDHIVDTLPGRGDETRMPSGRDFIVATREAAREAGIRLFDIGDDEQGIVHVISPELGIAQPGLTLVCPDSHTCTQGALGALAWGIGSTEAEHALATQTLALRKPKNMRVTYRGHLPFGVSAKDMILHLIGQHSASGGLGHAVEFAGEAVRSLPMESRLTLCNMAVEFGAWTGIIAPDQTTIEYVEGRRYAPKGDQWRRAIESWAQLATDDDAVFDREISVDTADIVPQITWGTSPMHGGDIDALVPDPDAADSASRRQAMEGALEYMGLKPGMSLEGLPIDAAFIGSCTNARLSDLRSAAKVLEGRKVAPNVRAICVPGSTSVKRRAEEAGLDRIFREAGFEWRESGCSMCFFAGGESFGPQERVVTSTNRNFESRQGPGTRSHLASPATVAASAVAGRIADVRKLAEAA